MISPDDASACLSLAYKYTSLVGCVQDQRPALMADPLLALIAQQRDLLDQQFKARVEAIADGRIELKTDWFPSTIKPVRPGMYEVGHDPATMPHHNSRHRLTVAPRRLWDGETWRAGWLNEKVSIFGSHPSHRWRGLTRASCTPSGAQPVENPPV